MLTMKQCFFKLFFLCTVACLQGYFVIVSKLIFWAFSDECLPILKSFSICFDYIQLGLPHHHCLYFFSSVFLCNIRKSYISDSLGIWKLVRGVVKSYRAESRVRIISFFPAVWMCQCYHSSMYYYFHKIVQIRKIIMHA